MCPSRRSIDGDGALRRSRDGTTGTGFIQPGRVRLRSDLSASHGGLNRSSHHATGPAPCSIFLWDESQTKLRLDAGRMICPSRAYRIPRYHDETQTRSMRSRWRMILQLESSKVDGDACHIKDHIQYHVRVVREALCAVLWTRRVVSCHDRKDRLYEPLSTSWWME